MSPRPENSEHLDADSFRFKIQEHQLQYEQEKFKRLNENRRGLENKAQINVTISGIFIGAGFSFISNIVGKSITIQLGPTEKICLFMAVFLFICSVILSVITLFTRKTPAPAEETVLDNILKIIPDKNEIEENIKKLRYQSFFDINSAWRKANKSLGQHNDTRGTILFISQCCLASGVIFIGFTCLSLIFR